MKWVVVQARVVFGSQSAGLRVGCVSGMQRFGEDAAGV